MLQWFFFKKNISITQCLDITLLCYESHTWNSSNSDILDILDIPIAQILDIEKVSRCTLLSAGLRRNFALEWIWMVRMVAPAPAFRLPFPCCFQFSWPVRFCKKETCQDVSQRCMSHTHRGAIWRVGDFKHSSQLWIKHETYQWYPITSHLSTKFKSALIITLFIWLSSGHKLPFAL